MNKTDYKDMWVFIERDGDSVLPVSLELCSETRKLCDASGEKLVAVIVGCISDGELQRVLDCGVDKVIHVTGTGYDYFNNDAYTNLFTVLCRKYRPTAVMVSRSFFADSSIHACLFRSLLLRLLSFDFSLCIFLAQAGQYFDMPERGTYSTPHTVQFLGFNAVHRFVGVICNSPTKPMNL